MTILAYEGANEKQIQSNKYSFEGQPDSNLTQVTSILQMTSPYSAFEHLPVPELYTSLKTFTSSLLCLERFCLISA